MIVKLKMRTTGKSFGKTCVKKPTEVFFFQVCGLWSGEGWGDT